MKKEISSQNCSCEVKKSSFEKQSGNISQKSTSGPVECSFDNNAKKFSPESIDFPPKVQKRWTEKKLKLIHFPWKLN